MYRLGAQILAKFSAAAMVLAGLAGAVGFTEAHFLLNVNIRVVHVEHLQDGLRVYIRLPMPLVVAGFGGPARGDAAPTRAPYTRDAIENGQLMHYLDVDALQRDPKGLGRLVAEGHQLILDQRPLPATVEAVRAHSALTQPLFSNLDQAKAALEGPLYSHSRGALPSYVGDTVVDVRLFYPTDGPVYRYGFASTLRPGLAGESDTANVLLDYGPGATEIFRASGLLDRPIEVSRSRLSAASTFIKEGIRHIWAGTDHVLFVLCLTIGAMSLGNLLWRITGFTLGHTITLIAGFLGYAPTGTWFIPTVEMAIAISIVYAGVVAVLRRPGAASFIVAALIGLLHGFGFSFMLHEILRVDSPDLWVSLLSFNLGIEIGQVGLVAVVWPLLMLFDRRFAYLTQAIRAAVSIPCIAVAALWTGQRLVVLLQQTAT
jgi:hypothetical protein